MDGYFEAQLEKYKSKQNAEIVKNIRELHSKIADMEDVTEFGRYWILDNIEEAFGGNW